MHGLILLIQNQTNINLRRIHIKRVYRDFFKQHEDCCSACFGLFVYFLLFALKFKIIYIYLKDQNQRI